MKLFMAQGRWVLLMLLTGIIISCARLPVIKPVEQTAATIQRCAHPFLDAPYRFVHAINVELPGGSTSTLLGITLFDPSSKAIHSAIITIEGFVLFDGQYEKELLVNRALPPFDAKNFAEHMMEDIRLIFLSPAEGPSAAGISDDGSAVCRYEGKRDRVVDVIVHRDSTWEIVQYGNRHELIRTIKAFSVRDRIPEMVELTGFESRRYSLRLMLISAEPVSPEAILQRPGEAADVKEHD
jgi:hypothetical protein